MDLVTSLPLPPDYWADLTVDQIGKMTPPSADLFDSSSASFGYSSEPLPCDLEQDSRISRGDIIFFSLVVSDIFNGLTGDLKECMESFMELIESTLDEEKVKQSSGLDHPVSVLAEKFTSMHSTIARLKFHEVL